MNLINLSKNLIFYKLAWISVIRLPNQPNQNISVWFGLVLEVIRFGFSFEFGPPNLVRLIRFGLVWNRTNRMLTPRLIKIRNI